MKHLFTLFKTSSVFAFIGALLCFGLLAFPVHAAPQDGTGAFFRIASVVDENANALDDFNSDVMDSANFQQFIITVNAVENSGAVTVDLTVEMSNDNSNWFTTGVTFTQLAATGTETKTLLTGAFHRYIRVAVDFSAAADWDIDLYMTAKNGP